MIKTLVWGFCGDNGKHIIQKLRTKLDISSYISDQECSEDIWSFLLGRIDAVESNKEAICTYKAFHGNFFQTFQIMVTRRGLYFSDYHELHNEFSVLFHYFYKRLSEEQPELVLLSNLPHEGPDYILYQTAKLLGIKTLMCAQSLFPNRFFLTTAMSDFGYFNTIPPIFCHNDIERILIEKPDLFYMKSIDKLQAQEKSSHLEKVKNNFLKSAGSISLKLQRLQDLKNNPASLNFINLTKKLANSGLKNRYNCALEKYSINRNKLNRVLNETDKIVYFPLHLQPELTTSATGGFFQDQLHAIEVLSQLLGKDWIILVKENPKQSHFQRNPLFFKRLNKIPNTYLVDKLFPSQILINNSKFVATITGTAGWEAVKIGQKCLVFGQAWYTGLENCIAYNDDFDVKVFFRFLQRSPSSDSLKTSFEGLIKKSALGVVDSYYSPLIENFDININAQQVASSLMEIIQHPKTKWNAE